MLKIPLEILVPLLELNTYPECLFIRASLGRENHLYFSDNISSLVYESLMYDLTTNSASDISNNWKQLIEDFCQKGFVFEEFSKRYPSLVEKGRIHSCKISYSPDDFKLEPRIPAKTPKEMTEQELNELHRNAPDQYWDQIEGMFV